MQQSYFALLNLEARFALPREQLDAAYRELAERVHPDRFAQAGATAQRRALTLAADVNEAYRTLRRPALRARHLLQLRGIDSDRLRPSSEFLLQQMEWREALTAAQQAQDPSAARRLHASLTAAVGAVQARLEAQLDLTPDNAAAAESLVELVFLEKLAQAVDEACAALEESWRS